MGVAQTGGVGGLIARAYRFRHRWGNSHGGRRRFPLQEETVNVLCRRAATALMGLVIPLVLLAPVAQATGDLRCSSAVEPLGQCESRDRGSFVVPSPVEYLVGFPALGNAD